MGTGIIVCGLNGAGKSTLGKAIAEKSNFHFIDIENLYFPKTDTHYLYASPRTRQEVEKLLFHEMNAHENFVLASVKGNYGEAVCSLLKLAVLIEVPKEIRMQRVENRSYQKFGNRIVPGGDLYEREKAFFDLVRSRPENTVTEWLQSLNCPVIRVDGTMPVADNATLIIEQIQNYF